MRVRAVVASHNAQAHYLGHAVVQQRDAGIVVELLGTAVATIVRMVAQAGIDRGLEAMKLLGHTFIDKWADADVNNVTANKDQVGMLGIDKVYPPGQFMAAIVIA